MGPMCFPETSVKIANLGCVRFQKSEDLSYTAAEAWNLERTRKLYGSEGKILVLKQRLSVRFCHHD